MLHETFKSLLARKLRLLLTALAVVLGGTLVFTDTMSTTFDKLFATAYSVPDVGVRGKSASEPTSPTAVTQARPVRRSLRASSTRSAARSRGRWSRGSR